MKDLIKVENLDFKYYSDLILKKISFSVNKGKFIGILGPNGCGKTTLLKNICRLLKPDYGNISIANTDLRSYKVKDLAKIIGVVHQENEVNFDFSVFEIVLMGRYPYLKRFRDESKIDVEIVKKAMVATDVWNLRDKNINEISGGERQRVMIARAIAQQPDIILLDEPISNLDIKHQINILNLLRSLKNNNKLTIISTLHDINLANIFCDLILLLKKGEIVAFDKPELVLTKENIKSTYEIDVKFLIDNQNKIIVPNIK